MTGEGESGPTKETLREKLDALREFEAYQLAGTSPDDWASELAGKLVDILVGYCDGVLPMEELPAPAAPADGAGGGDDLEDYCRKVAASSPAMTLDLLLPAAWAHVGALTGGGVWAYWNGRKSVQACPATVQQIGLADSGAGKSSTLRSLGRWFDPAMAAAEAEVAAEVTAWAARARDAVDKTLEPLKPGPASGPEEMTEWRKGRAAVLRVIDGIDLSVSRGVQTSYGDATAEGLVSGAIEYGGVAFVRAAEQDVLDNLTRYSARGGGASLTWLTDGWDGAGYRRVRKGSGVEETDAFCLSMSLLTQTESFFRSFVEGSGDAWLDKGLLGRVLVSMSPRGSLDADVAGDLAVRSGVVEEVPVGGLVEAATAVGGLGAAARAARLVEARLMSALASLAAGGLSAGGGKIEKAGMGAAAGPGVLPRPMNLGSFGSAAGAAGLEGIGLEVSDEDAVRLEDLHTWLVRALGHALPGDRVLGPVLSRLTYHLVRLAAVRSVWNWTGAEEVDPAVLRDTATRVMPWVLRGHLRVLGGLVERRAQEDVRRELVTARGRDTSMAGAVAEALKASGAGVGDFPMSATEVAKRVARGQGHGFREAVLRWMRDEYDAMMRGEEAGPYLRIGKGRKEGSVVVLGFSPENPVLPAPAYVAGGGGAGG